MKKFFVSIYFCSPFLCMIAAACFWPAFLDQPATAQGTKADARQTDEDQPAPKAPRPRPAPKAKAGAAATPGPAAVPKEGSLYVWQLPEEGFQTLLVLRVTGPDTFEGAYLVPVRVKLPADAPKDAALAKKGAEALDALVGGRLVNASLRGRTAGGALLADIHLGAGSKEDPKQPSGWLTELLVRQKHLTATPRPK